MQGPTLSGLNAALGGQMTLDGLLRREAERHPERPALSDDRLRDAGGVLSWADANRWVDAVAGALVANGLLPGNVVAASLHQTVESVIALLAAWRVGLIVAPIPAVWQSRDCVSNLPRLSPLALLTTGDRSSAATLRTYADRLGSVRGVLAFGTDLPPRVVAMPGRPAASGAVAPVSRPISADGPLTITMTATGRRGSPIHHVRKQSHWIAAGLSLFLEADLTDGAAILSTYQLSGLVGIGAGLIPWLLTTGTLHLHEFASAEALSRLDAEVKPDCVIVPAEVALSLTLDEGRAPAVVAAWKDAHDPTLATAPLPGRGIDLTTIGELGFAAVERSGAGPAAIALGNVTSPSDDPDGAVLFEARVDAATRMPSAAGSGHTMLFSVSGPMVPDAVRLPGNGASLTTGLIVAADHFVRTDIACRLAEGTPARAVPLGRAGDVIAVGGLTAEAAALDEIFASMPGIEAAAAVMVDFGEGVELVAAVVPRSAGGFVPGEYLAALQEAGVATHFRPRHAIVVAAIPRGPHGGVLREAIAADVRAARQPAEAERVARAS